MQDDGLIIRSIIAGIVGGELVDWVAGQDRQIKLPFVVIYSLCFTMIYSLTLLFFGVAYFLFDRAIPWAKFSIVVMVISVLISLILTIIDGRQHRP